MNELLDKWSRVDINFSMICIFYIWNAIFMVIKVIRTCQNLNKVIRTCHNMTFFIPIMLHHSANFDLFPNAAASITSFPCFAWEIIQKLSYLDGVYVSETLTKEAFSLCVLLMWLITRSLGEMYWFI